MIWATPLFGLQWSGHQSGDLGYSTFWATVEWPPKCVVVATKVVIWATEVGAWVGGWVGGWVAGNQGQQRDVGGVGGRKEKSG